MAIQYLENEIINGKLSISVITAIELIQGAGNKIDQRRAKELIKKFNIVYISKEISKKAFSLMSVHHLAYSLEMADSLIAASAIYYKTELVTRNIKDYRFISGLNIKSPY